MYLANWMVPDSLVGLVLCDSGPILQEVDHGRSDGSPRGDRKAGDGTWMD